MGTKSFSGTTMVTYTEFRKQPHGNTLKECVFFCTEALSENLGVGGMTKKKKKKKTEIGNAGHSGKGDKFLLLLSPAFTWFNSPCCLYHREPECYIS